MKRIAIAALAFFFLLPLAHCNKSGGDSADYGFSIYPGRVFYGGGSNAGKAHDITFHGGRSCGPASTCYAVLYSSVLNGVSHVGIEVEQETATEVFTMKIWYQGVLTVPGNSGALTTANSTIKVNVRNKETGVTDKYIYSSGGPITLTYTLTGSIYHITCAGTANLTAPGPLTESLTITSIDAIKVP